MEVIDDIGDTATDSEDEEEEELKNAQIVGVPMFDKYRSCLRCKARVEPCSSTTATCSRDDCQMLQRYDVCPEQLSAKLLFKSGSTFIPLHAYGKILLDITNAE